MAAYCLYVLQLRINPSGVFDRREFAFVVLQRVQTSVAGFVSASEHVAWCAFHVAIYVTLIALVVVWVRGYMCLTADSTHQTPHCEKQTAEID